jgi:electron transfer flavoprotein alpha subunit
LKLVRQEFGGQVSAHVRCDISSGAVITIRPGAFKPLESAPAGGVVVDKSAAVGALTSGRRYLETIAPEMGDVDITKYPVLVSIGRGIQEQENVAIAQDLADALGGGGELLAARGGRQVDGEIPAGGIVRPDRQAQGLPGMRHQRIVPAPGRH